ncbi:MAG: DJ-1/PfpI family protein [Candidatus Hodarchaeota archaeon]
MKKYISLLTFCFLIISNPASYSYSTVSIIESEGNPSDLKVLMIVDNAFGYTYFLVKNYLESWGINVITASATGSKLVTGCYNQPPNSTTADILISDITNITEYDAIHIPSGGHWKSLIGKTEVLDLIKQAYNNQVIVSALCIGLKVLAKAEIIKNVRMCGHPLAQADVTLAEGIYMDERVVVDQRIISGGFGGGVRRYDEAPNFEMSYMLTKNMLGYSPFTDLEINATKDNIGIKVSLNNMDPFNEIVDNAYNLTDVHLNFRTTDKENLLVKSYLLVNTGTGFEKNIQDLDEGKYSIELAFEDKNGCLEFYPNLMIVDTRSNKIPGFTIFLGFITIFMIAFYRKRQK